MRQHHSSSTRHHSSSTRHHSSRTRHEHRGFAFAAQSVAWGAVVLAVGASGLRSLQLRDLGAATRLDRFLWLNLGLDTGYVAVGGAIALSAWLLGRRYGGVGAGVAIIAQGLALAIITARLLLVLEQFV